MPGGRVAVTQGGTAAKLPDQRAACHACQSRVASSAA